MKRIKGLLLLSLSLGSVATYANPVGVQTAKQVAKNFMTGMGVSSQATFDLTRTYTSTAPSAASSFYIFSIDNGKGFVIVSADDAVTPILGYSAENTFPAQVTNKEVAYWMDGYNEQISYVIAHNVAATADITASWAKLINNTQGNTAAKPTDVAPLLTTTWDQEGSGNIYNNFCPTNTPTGCVATAMAQIMKYWNAPTTGTGTHTYTYSNANINGTLTANFGTTTYDWANMPNTLTSSSPNVQKNAIGTLMSHCGISVDMDYNYGSDGGSGAFVIISGSPVQNCSEYALTHYFGYSSDIQGLARASYTDAVWIGKLKAELDASRPILYTGFGAVGGHAFVFDGYNDNNNTFHINWGWSGMSNGYFIINNLAPSALGVGGGGGNFNNGQQALMKIYPTNVVPDLEINAALTASNTNLNEGEGFSVSTNIKNVGAGDFNNGYFIAGVYKSSDNSLVSYFNNQSGQNLASGSDVTVTFTTPGIAAMTNGTYVVKVLYKPTSTSSWTVIDNGASTNSATINVGGTGINNVPNADLIRIYPVPAKNNITIDFSKFDSKVTDVRLTNMQGRTVYNQSVNKGTTARIDVGGFADGLYFLHIQTEKGTIAKKISIQK